MVSLVIPAFNEEKRLGNSLTQLSKFLKEQQEEFEVIIVDDGSTDKTETIAKGFEKSLPNLKIIRLEKNLGKGAAVNTGFFASQGDIVVFSDADFSTPIFEITKLMKKIEEGYDVVVGSRELDPTLVKKHQNFFRELMGKTFNILVQRIAVPGIRDTQCGFKAFFKPTTTKIFEKQIISGFGFDVELLFLARKLGLKYVEVPVLWYNDERSSVSPLKHSVVTLYELFKIRFHHSKERSSLLDKLLHQFYRRKTFGKFVIVGLSATFVDFFGYLFLTRIFGLPPLLANPLNVEAAIIWSFTLNNLWTFKGSNHQKSLPERFLTYQFVTFGSLLFSQIQILLYLNFLGLHDAIAKLITLPTVALFNYSIHKRWTFRDISKGKANVALFVILIFGLLLVYLLLSVKV